MVITYKLFFTIIFHEMFSFGTSRTLSLTKLCDQLEQQNQNTHRNCDMLTVLTQ